MNNNKKAHYPYVGGSGLIVIFAVLCLVIFAMMMLTTEISARKLSQVSADAIKDYYIADTKAEITFANIKTGEILDHVTQNGTVYTYNEEISETMYLNVEVTYRNGEWVILRWQAQSTVR